MSNDRVYSKKPALSPTLKRQGLSLATKWEFIKSIALLDFAGKEVCIVNNLKTTKIEFNLVDVAFGLYHLKVTSNSGISKIFKLVKQ